MRPVSESFTPKMKDISSKNQHFEQKDSQLEENEDIFSARYSSN